MIAVMKEGASSEQIQHVIWRVESLGLKAHPIYGTERTVITAVGEERDGSFEPTMQLCRKVAEAIGRQSG